MRSIHLVALGLLFCSLGLLAQESYEYFRLPRILIDSKLVHKFGFIRDHKSHSEFAFGYLPNSKVTREVIREYQLLKLNEALLRTIDFDPVTLQEKSHPIIRDDNEATEPYHTYETLSAELKNLAARYPDFVKLESAGKSVQGRELWLVRISNYKQSVESRPKLLYVSSMHGDEVTGKEMMVYFIRQLLNDFSRNERIKLLMNTAELFIIPSMNPDGTELHQRFNANNIDLNRNFPHLDEAGDSRAGREPETLALMDLHTKHHFAVGMNFHGGEICVNLPWDSTPNEKPEQLFGDNELMWLLGNRYASTNLPMYNNHVENFIHGVTFGYEWFQILGGMQDWAVFNRQTSHATLEISVTKWPAASSLGQFWKDNQESLLAYLESAMTGFHYKVVDAVTGQLLKLNVSMESATRALSYEGFVHRPSIPKTQKVSFSAEGYETLTIEATPRAYNGALELISLKRR